MTMVMWLHSAFKTDKETWGKKSKRGTETVVQRSLQQTLYVFPLPAVQTLAQYLLLTSCANTSSVHSPDQLRKH